MEEQDLLNILSTKKVLCVEDEAYILDNIMESLELFFDRVDGAKDGIEALDAFERNQYDVVMLDISMPHMDGLEVAKRIRECDKNVVIVILSAHVEQEYLWRAVELKITRYLAKPYDKKMLLDALNDIAKDLVGESPYAPLTTTCRYNYCKKIIYNNDEVIHLSKSESKLLEYFIKRANQTITYDQLFDYMWDFEQPSKEAIKSIIKGLRKKIDNDFIKNLYGVGYICEIQL